MISVERKQFLSIIEAAARFALPKCNQPSYRLVYLTYNKGSLNVESFGGELKYTGEIPIWGDDGDDRWCAAVDPKPLMTLLKKSGKGKGDYDTTIKYQDSGELCIVTNGARSDIANWLVGEDMPPPFSLPENRESRRLRSIYFDLKSLDIAASLTPNQPWDSVNHITENVMVDLHRQLLVSTEEHALYSSPIQLLGGDPITNGKAILINKKMLQNIVKSIPSERKSEAVLLQVSLDNDRPSLSFYISSYSSVEALGQYEKIPEVFLSMLATNNEAERYPVYVNTGDLVSACKQISAFKANVMLRRASTNTLRFISISKDNNINISLATRTKNDIQDGIDDVVFNPNFLLTMLKHSSNSGESTIFFSKENASHSPIGIYSKSEYLNGMIMPMRQ